MNEYAYKQKACIRNKQPDCEAQAVIPSITVETVDGITNLANCLIHVTSTNTTYYVDDKHRVMITWAGPVNIPGYDMEENPNRYKNQIVTDTEAEIAVIYDKNGVGFTFGIRQDADFDEAVLAGVSAVLEEMVSDGTMKNLINQEVFGDINNRILAQAQDITSLEEAQANNVKKNEANSVSMNMLTQAVKDAMTGGSTPVVGIDSVGTEQLKDGSVTFTKLDDLLSDNLELEYESLEEGLTYVSGFYAVTGGQVGGNLNYYDTDPSTECVSVPLTKGKTYRFNGTSYSATFGLVIGTAVGSPVVGICPKNGKLNKDFYTEPLSDQQGSDYVFTVTDDGLSAFITRNKASSTNGISISVLNDTRGLYEVTKITTFDRDLELNTYRVLEPDYVHDGSFIIALSGDATKNPYRVRTLSDTRYKLKIYKLRNGHTYRVEGSQIYSNPGFELFDGSNIIQYISLESYITTAENYEYEFVATGDCFCVISDTPPSYSGVLYEKIHEDAPTTRLAGKTIAYNGDSITQSRTDTALVTYNGGAYPKLIADNTNSTYINFAKGGATLAYKSGGYRICRDIDNMNGDYDAIVFSGGINDYWQNIPLGTYNKTDYTGAIDDTTVCGALESIFRQAINKWCGKPIMFVITHKIYGTAYTQNTAGYTFEGLHDAIVGICDKYSIPYYDCYKEGGLNSYMSIMNTTYMTAGASGQPDYTHPNEAAYKRYYVPQVIKMLEDNLPY